MFESGQDMSVKKLAETIIAHEKARTSFAAISIGVAIISLLLAIKRGRK